MGVTISGGTHFFYIYSFGGVFSSAVYKKIGFNIILVIR